ncbi:MAG: acireductone synthase [Gammaproteobacteria bacterium]
MIKAIVTDIEGTTTALSFVKDVLFPYAREHLEAFVRANAEDPQIQILLSAAQREIGAPLELDALIAQFIRWIDEDRKITPLKALQGLIWDYGYRQGAFTGHIYPDAAEALEKWHAHGIALYVYSSGSVQAQKLLFGHSNAGDLTPLFSGYFDTNIGGKKETESYRRIATEIGLAPETILFLSDIEDELDAARNAGMLTCWLVRGQRPDVSAAHRQAASFDQITESSAI